VAPANKYCVQFVNIFVSREIAGGWVIPEQLAMVGAGNHEIIRNAIDPTWSSIDMGNHQCGYEAARLVDRLLQRRPKPSTPWSDYRVLPYHDAKNLS
jgi:DNA-binding LacI/PurR family transcriptional regulator